MVDGFGDDLYDSVLRRKSLAEQTAPSGRHGAGIGYVILPSDVDRDSYVESCLRKKTVSIMTEQGEFINDVPVGKLTLQFIEFPSTDGNNSRRLGSPVGFVNIQGRNKPIIFDVFDASDEFNVTPENSFTLIKKTSSASTLITGNGFTGDIIATSTSSEGGNGITVSVHNKVSDGYLNVDVEGVVNVSARKAMSLKSGESLLVEIKDEVADFGTSNANKYARLSFDNSTFSIKIGEVNPTTGEFIDSKTSVFSYDVDNANIFPLSKVTLGNGVEAMALGDTLKALLDDFITAVSSITTTTLLGPQPIINKVQVEALKMRTKSILSKYGFLD